MTFHNMTCSICYDNNDNLYTLHLNPSRGEKPDHVFLIRRENSPTAHISACTTANVFYYSADSVQPSLLLPASDR